ncbi:hypothetical protein KR767_19045 [Luteibacter anthropi]|uniref:Uncharacterized protein n=1 Tax=Luteibacter anthropi TaxID=564369 RepID=A0A7X5ZIZ0_9GAMM|nr:hypothetical protein [Luteibacter anthropi]NII07372.1 hypothetical protein [Luteibacter anthropi]URX62117.1 hypothetical protein KR767_19045 [Luteibacter anthropi]
MNQAFLKGAFALACMLALPVATAAVDVQRPDANRYPAKGGTEYEQSIITIPLYAAGKAEPVEILKLTAFMRLEREAPRTNGLGHRQVEFTIAQWELIGHSNYLDSDVFFKLSDVPVQPKSLVISLTEKADYPAMIVYNAIYDIYIGNKLVAKNRPGVAFAKNVFEIPPRNISVAFSKPFTVPVDSLTSASARKAVGQAGGVEFSDGTCEDMSQIEKSVFDKGIETIQAARTAATPVDR